MNNPSAPSPEVQAISQTPPTPTTQVIQNTKPTTQSVTPQATPNQPVFATFGTRFLASIIDSFIMGTASGLLSLPLTILSSILVNGPEDQGIALLISLISFLVSIAIYVGYPVYFIGKKGETLGKSAMKIKVVKLANNTEEIGYSTAFLRETVGKLLSSFLLLGYLTMPGDKNKQTWHDKIAGTIVIKVS